MAQYRIDEQEFLPNGTTIFEVNMLADKDGNVISAFGAASNIPVAAGLVDGYSHINKFGYTGTDVNGSATIWDGNAVTASYPFPAAASVVTATGATSADDGETIEIQGLNQLWMPATETITIGGAASTTQFLRVFRAKMTSATNTVLISVQNNTPTIIAQIRPGNAQTLMAVYTVPAGKTGYLIQINCSVDKSTSGIFRLFARTDGDGGVFNLKGQYGTFASPVTIEYPVPLKFPEKTDLRVDILTTNTVGGGAIFDVILVDNPA